MLKAVVFDLDGTVLDTLPDLNICMNKALADYGFPTISLEQTRAYVGHGGRNYALAALPAEKREIVDEFYAHYCTIHVSCKNEHTHPFSGEAECLSALRKAGIKLAVVTNKSQAAADVLAGTLLKDYGFSIVQGNRPEFAVKPRSRIHSLRTETARRIRGGCGFCGGRGYGRADGAKPPVCAR